MDLQDLIETPNLPNLQISWLTSHGHFEIFDTDTDIWPIKTFLKIEFAELQTPPKIMNFYLQQGKYGVRPKCLSVSTSYVRLTQWD